MKIGKAFPSKYIKVDDLNDSDMVVTISKVDLEEIGQGDEKQEKLIAHFKELDKGMVLNKTNCRIIEKMYGDETDDWIGKRITLWPNHDVQFGSEIVSAIRVRSKPPAIPGSGQKPSEKISAGNMTQWLNLAADIKKIVGDEFYYKVLGNAGFEHADAVKFNDQQRPVIMEFMIELEGDNKKKIIADHNEILRRLRIVSAA